MTTVKTFFLNLSILNTLFFSYLWVPTEAFAALGESAKSAMKKEALRGLELHKKENGGKIDLVKFKPLLMEELYSYYEYERINRDGLLGIKTQYEKLEVKSKKLTQIQIEQELIQLHSQLIKLVDASSKQCTKEGLVCNNWGCCGGLVCHDVPVRARKFMNSCLRSNTLCQKNRDCCSGTCGEGLNGKKVCAMVKRCYRPQKIKFSCDQNPVCEVGECELYNAGTIGIGECVQDGRSCKKNTECCSNQCSKGKCSPYRICKSCVKQGVAPRKSEKCCEGLYKGLSGRCIPVLPPFVRKEKELKKSFSIFGIFVSFFFGENSWAEDDKNRLRSDENKKITNRIESDKKLQEEAQIKSFSGTGKRVRDGVSIAEKDDFKKHEFETYGTQAGTDFKTCRINLRADYLINLKNNKDLNLLGAEMAVLAFEHMSLGEGTQDYWNADQGSKDTNIHSRAKAIALKHLNNRKKIFNELSTWQAKMECLCLDSKGYPSLTGANKEKFQEQCPDNYAAYKSYRDSNPHTDDESYEGDASGIKGKELISRWTELNSEFYSRMFINNTGTYAEMNDLANWLENNPWGENETESFPVFKYTTTEWRNIPELTAATTLALLAAGVIAITGGFAATTMASLWVSFGIIAGAGSVGVGGTWLIGAMKGAWESRSPYLQDEYVRTWKCGKKSQCSDFERSLILPKSKACDGEYVTGNGCIKNFLVTTIEGEERFIVDPLVPLGVEKTLILKDNVSLASRMSRAAKKTVEKLQLKKPDQNRVVHFGNSRFDIVIPKSTDYIKRPLLDAVETGNLAPNLKRPYEKYYRLNSEMITKIKESAKKYAIDQELLSSSMTEDLKKFADYAYQYHFLWPRLSQKGMIAYPMPGMGTYFSMMSQALNSKVTVDGLNQEGYTKLSIVHLQDLNKTLRGFQNRVQLKLEGGTGFSKKNFDEKIRKNELKLAEIAAFQGAVFDITGNNSAAQLSNGGEFVSETNKSLVGSVKLDPKSTLGQVALAIKTNRVIKTQQQAKLSAFKKALGEGKANDLISKRKAFVKDFFPSIGSAGNQGTGKAGRPSLQGVSIPGGENEKDPNKKKSFNRNNGQGGGASFSRSKYNYNGNYGGNYKSGGIERGHNENSNSQEGKERLADQRKIKEAIEFRDKNPGKFEAQSGDSLFEILTRTYIRAYDKLLNKKK